MFSKRYHKLQFYFNYFSEQGDNLFIYPIYFLCTTSNMQLFPKLHYIHFIFVKRDARPTRVRFSTSEYYAYLACQFIIHSKNKNTLFCVLFKIKKTVLLKWHWARWRYWKQKLSRAPFKSSLQNSSMLEILHGFIRWTIFIKNS